MIKTSAIVALTTLLATALGSPEVLAQSADDTPTQQPAKSSTAQAAPKKSEAATKEQAKADSKDKDKDKSFIPSEEISEDFAVSFPVDI